MLSPLEKLNLKKLIEKYNLQYLRATNPTKYPLTLQKDIFIDVGNNQKRRRIFYQVDYQNFEQVAIRKVKDALEKETLQYNNLTNQLILKQIYQCKFDIDKTVQRLKEVIKYHTNPIVTKFDTDTINNIQKGCIYTYGNDRQGYPIIVLRADKFDYTRSVDQNYNFVYYLMLVVMNYRMTPYNAEKYVVIMDFNNMDLTDIPYKYLYDILSKMSVYYCGNTQKIFVYNIKGIGMMWKIFSSFLPEYQKKKIIFIEKGKETQILEYVEEQQLQKRYGGKLLNIHQYWPPRLVNENIHLVEEQTDFYSAQNDYQYFTEQQAIKKNSCECNIY